MIRYILGAIIIFQGVLVSAVVEKVTVKGVEIPLIYEQSTNLPIASLQVILKGAGSMQDGEKAGLARFTAAMLGEGTKSKGSVAFAEALESRAISLWANSGTETFVFEISALKEQFDFGLKMLKELLAEPNFSDESFSKIKQMTLGGIASKKSDFDYVANLNLKKMIFADTPMGHPFSGDMQSIEALTLSDIESFYKSHVDLANMILVVGGDVKIDDVKKQMQELLADVQVGEQRVLKHYTANDKAQYKQIEEESEQAYIYFGAPYNLQSNDPESYKSKVAGFILGESGFGSRMMEEIRVKRGLAYSAYSRTHVNKYSSYFSGYLQTKNENLQEAKEIVQKVIAEFVKDGVTQEELDQAKRFLLGSEPLRNETLNHRLSRAFHEYYRGFDLGHSKKQLELIENLSLDELNAYIKAHGEITKLTFSVVTSTVAAQ